MTSEGEEVVCEYDNDDIDEVFEMLPKKGRLRKRDVKKLTEYVWDGKSLVFFSPARCHNFLANDLSND